MRPFQSIKLVIVGTSGVGKTSLLISYTRGSFPHNYIPRIFESYSESFKDPTGANPEITYSLFPWDTACTQDNDRLRPLSYPQTDIFLLCFDVGNLKSSQDVKNKWADEVRTYCPEAIVVVVGTKTDLRGAREQVPGQEGTRTRRTMTLEQGVALANEIGADGYFECSALNGEGVKNLFVGSMQLVLDKFKREEKIGSSCCIVV